MAPDTSEDWTVLFCRLYGACSKVISIAIDRLLYNTSRPMEPVKEPSELEERARSLPPMPGGTRQLVSVLSSWAMHVDQFKDYTDFARMFLVALESMSDVHGNASRCPLSFRGQRHGHGQRLCWSVIMERIVNVFARHRGLKLLHINPENGRILEMDGIKEPWKFWLGKKKLRNVTDSFEGRLNTVSLSLYRHLGGH